MRTPALASGRLPGRTVIYYRDLVLALLGKEFKVRYKSTFMGYAWSVLHPLALAFIFFNVFSFLIRDVTDYPLYLISGLFAWQWISNTCGCANRYFLGNSSLIKKVRFQRSMLAVSGELNESIHFVVSIPVIVVFMLYFGHVPRLDWLWLVPTLLVVQSAMMLGLSLLIATSNLFFRDLERLVGLVVQMLFYLTPIIYPVSRIPADYRWIFYANPFASIIICWQNVFYAGQFQAVYLGVAMTWAWGLLAIGLLVYHKKVWRFAEIV